MQVLQYSGITPGSSYDFPTPPPVFACSLSEVAMSLTQAVLG